MQERFLERALFGLFVFEPVEEFLPHAAVSKMGTVPAVTQFLNSVLIGIFQKLLGPVKADGVDFIQNRVSRGL